MGEVHHEQSVGKFGHVQPVEVIKVVIHEMGVADVGIVTIPAMGGLEVVTIDVLNFVHFDLADWVEVECIYKHSTVTEGELRVLVNIDNDEQLVHHLKIFTITSRCEIRSPCKSSMCRVRSDVNVGTLSLHATTSNRH